MTLPPPAPAPAGALPTREAFQQHLLSARTAARRQLNRLAVISVGLGVAQLAFLRWAERSLADSVRVPLAVAFFLAYAAIISFLVLRLMRTERAVRPACPHCATQLRGLSERAALATGRCDGCGGQLFA